jgi:Ribosomal protein L11 methyltransferase (PrmA)/Arginine methyltransferase oligomerization subdomain
MINNLYSLAGYGEMIADHIRMEAFTQALRGAIHPGAVVMDIGTGPGSMAVLACKLGASRVYAIEPCDVIQVAREIASANHCADKIEFFEDVSTKVSIPVLADVIVSDMRGVLPLFGQHIPSIVDARRRFLASGGTLIARKDRIWAAVVDTPKDYGRIVDAWDCNMLGQDLGVARRKVLNEFRKVRMASDQLLTVPQLWAKLDYTTIENPDVRGTLQWETQRAGTGHGILVWFDMELAEGVALSNGPASPEAIYGSALFPWLEPVPLAAGQNVCVDLEAKLLENDYFWRWTTQIASAERPGEIAVRFEQSQLQGSVLSPASLRRAASDYVPQLSDEGLLRRRAFDLMDGESTLEDIARQLTAEFPSRFTRWQQALTFVGVISKENGR